MTPLASRFYRLTLINILSSIAVPLAGLVDKGMLGHLDVISYLAGVALATVIFDTLYWSVSFLRMSTAGLTAQAVGEGNREEVHQTLHRALLIAGAMGLAIVLFQVPIREVGFRLLGGGAEVEAAGREYFEARIWGAPATLINFALIGWWLGRARSGVALVMTLTANLTNVLFNYLFIVQWGMAARGAGYATMLSQYAMLLVGVAVFLAVAEKQTWRLAQVIHADKIRHLFQLNRDIFLRTLALVVCFAVFTNFSAVLGELPLAANAILLGLFYLAAYAIDGAAIATESMAGIAKGARNLVDLRSVIRMALGASLVFSAAFLVLFFAAPHFWLGLLTSHAGVIRYAAHYSPWLIPVLLFGALAFAYDGLFIGLTEARRLRNAMLISAGLVFLPLAATGIYLRNNTLLWLALTLFMVARTLTLGVSSQTLMREYERWADPKSPCSTPAT